MKTLFMPHEIADKLISGANLPTSDGKNILPVHPEVVKLLIAQAITEDRVTDEPDFMTIADAVMASHGQGDTRPVIRNTVLLALRYAQSAGARFQKGGPTEADYAEGVQNAVEAFTATLKDKGLWN